MLRRIAGPAHALSTLLAVTAALLCAPTRGDNAVFIEAGEPRLTLDLMEAWQQADGSLQGGGQANLLYAKKAIGPGDFRIKTRLRIVGLARSAAAFQLGPNYFGFEGATGRTYLNGPMFGGGVSFLGPGSDLVKDGQWFEFEVIRADEDIRFLIDGKVVHSVTFNAGPIGRIGFYPWRSTMHVSDFSAEAHTMSDLSIQPRHYTIPTIDLAAETGRQVIIDREAGQYLGHPTTVLLEDNKTMIIVYPKGHGAGAIVMKRSTDAGLTWSERLEVPENWATSKEVPTIYRVVDQAGVKRLILFSGLYPIRMAVSEDDGQTWSPLEPIGDFGGIVAMSDLIRLADGRYMTLFHDDGRFLHGEGKVTSFTMFKSVSDDGGLTWSPPVAIAKHPTAHLCEGGFVRSPDGKQIAILLRENSRQSNSFAVYSEDEGETWSEPVELPAALTGDRHQAVYAPDGRLVISFRDTTHVSPTKGDWVAWVGTYEDIVEGREGQYRVRLMDNTKGADCAYPALELLPDGTIVATTYGHWTEGEAPYIASVRFKLDEIDQKAAAQAADKGGEDG